MFYFLRESYNSTDDQTDIRDNPSFEYNFDIELDDESSGLELETDIETELPKEILDMVERHENHLKPNIEEARTAYTEGENCYPAEILYSVGLLCSDVIAFAPTPACSLIPPTFAYTYASILFTG